MNDAGVPRNLRVDQILTTLFGVPSLRNERVRRLFAERVELTDKAELSEEEENRLQEIRRQIDQLPTAEDGSDQVAMDLIRRFAARLQDQESTGP